MLMKNWFIGQFHYRNVNKHKKKNIENMFLKKPNRNRKKHWKDEK